MTTTLSAIETRVRQNVIHLPNQTDGRIREWVGKAQRELEDRKEWTAMKTRWVGDAFNTDGETLIDNFRMTNETLINQSSNPQSTFYGDFLRVARDRPYFIKGDTGELVEMEWLETHDQRFAAYEREFNINAPTTPTTVIDKGSPKYLFTEVDGSVGGPGDSVIGVFPFTDSLNPVGTYSAAGEYRVRFFIYRRLLTLTDTVQNNWFTDTMPEYLEHSASAMAMEFNEDNDAANRQHDLARKYLRIALRRDLKDQVGPGMSIRPRSGVRGGRLTGRA